MTTIRNRRKGFTLIELLIVVAIIGILAAIAIPNFIQSQRRARYTKASADTKVATTQSLVYGFDHSKYPQTLAALRTAGYATVGDLDPWGNAYQLSPPLLGGLAPGANDDTYVYSKGPTNAGTYPAPFVPSTGPSGSVGYSSAYGAWTGN